MKHILIIDDDTYICKLLTNYLNQNGFKADSAYSARSGLDKISKGSYDLILCDYRLPESDGLTLLKKIKQMNPAVPVIIMTAYADVRNAVSSIKSGAYDYLTKPVRPEEIVELIKDAINQKDTRKTNLSFQEEFITGSSKAIRGVMDHVRIVAPVEMTALIEGETGSGKEYIARFIHYNSKRRNKPFVAVDCGALPKGLVNSELFGHLKGSFTGASFDKKGVFEQADGGTLFLDEISNLDHANQTKLLRALQERKVTRIGDTKNIDIDVRIIVASNEDLLKEVRDNRIREDLYHRINEFKIILPPLRDRGEDVLVFADELVRRASIKFNKNITGYDQHVREIFLGYPWYGNIRELKNVINRAVLMATAEQITEDDIPEEIRNYTLYMDEKDPAAGPQKISRLELKDAALDAERDVIINALRQSNYNKSEAARILKIDRKTLYNKIKQLDIPLS